MSYTLEQGKLYRMPTHFGPSLGPRQGPDDRRFEVRESSKQRTLTARFAVSGGQFEPFLPPGFSVQSETILSISYTEITEIEWLAGRGYNTLGVTLGARCTGATEVVDGDFLMVLWENMCDPIITGREELGFSKIFCDLPPLRIMPDSIAAEASWDSHIFARIRAEGGHAIDPTELPASDSSGLLHYKYLPRTGAPGEADVAYPTLTPAAAPNLKVEKATRFDAAEVTFLKSSWEQLPTLVHIVNALAAIDLGESLGATLVETRGYKDLSDQRIVG
ncbi:MAG: acetoacetate decarboxylase family protein [Pseudomonadota bacterium]